MTEKEHLESWKMKRNEAYLQSECVKWFRLAYPKLKLRLFAVPNGGSRHAAEAKNLKRQGVLPGVSDLILLIPNRGFHGLCIEMKFKKGKQTEYQVEWQAEVEKEYKYSIIYNFDEFKELIDWYLE